MTAHIYTFNTGRQYSPAGQRIAYTEEPIDAMCSEVVFYDLDRGIPGVFTLVRPVTEAKLLGAYDQGGYGWCSDYELMDRLKAAAATAPSLEQQP